MYKILALAIAVVVMPLSEKTSGVVFSVNKSKEDPLCFLSFKNTTSLNPFEPEKKTVEAWSENWMAAAQENIRKSEYHFTWEKKLNAYCTPNRKNNLRFFYNEKGFSVMPRTTQIPIDGHDPLKLPGEIRYRSIPNWKINFNLDKKQVGNGKWQTVNNKAEYITDKITVQYINNDDGMRQNFIVNQPLSKKNELKINLRVKTKLRTGLSNDQLQFFHKKMNVLNYDQLKVWDAAGRQLNASFKKRDKYRFYIQVDTKGAVYPVTIDPLSTTPGAIVESDQPGAALGFAVASAGDVNGDGYSDIIVGAPGYNSPGVDEGVAFIYHGSALGINTTAAALVESNQDTCSFGVAVGSAGDVNGDGYGDVVVGAPFYDNGEQNEGVFFVYHGSAIGINTTAVVVIESNQAHAQLGFSVACAGNVNGDGYSDVIAGAWLFDDGESNEGVAFIYHGSAAGITATATTLQNNQVASNFGIAVASAGDVNGDGYGDVIVGAEDYDNGNTDEGVVFIYHGSGTGINSVAAASVDGNQDFCQFGFSVSSAGDVNGDGYSDIFVGAYLFDSGEINEGAGFIYHGSATGINTTIAALVQSDQPGANLGCFVACAGDINGDGYSDIITGANSYDNGQNNEGAAYVYFGSVAGLNTTAATILESNQAFANFGRGVASGGDVNGDGYSDVIVGASQYDNPDSNEGAAFVYHGSAAGINPLYTTMSEANQPAANLGFSVDGAGDVNGDGYSDVIMGAPYFDNTESNEGAAFVFHGSAAGINPVAVAMMESDQVNANLGFSVAGAGDVNGDGYSDIIVGAPNFDAPQVDEGRVFIYHGSASGINVVAVTTRESNQAGANLGYAVASAGDVNGDGYSDVVAGAYRYDNPQLDEGAAFIYPGSATGINNVVSTIVESNQANAYFGYSVAGVGSVNADGFSDIIVGAILFDNGENDEGAAFVYQGAATGINTVAAGMVQSDQVSAFMGFSVSGAGDVNGDGYSDVIVGAINYDNVQTDEGAAFVYHGTAAGINPIAVAILESNQANAYAGYAVANAGDVNGDGYSDVIVGAYNYDNPESNEGAAFIYHGSGAGINPVVAATIESNQTGAALGNAVAGAGDVNGDGYSDVIIGAYGFDNVEMNEGAAFVYHGNSLGMNRRNNLRLYNSNLVTPINNSNFSIGNFGAGLYARSFLGRAKGKMVWETRLNYNAYSGTPITNSTFFTAQQAAYTDMGLTGVELKTVVDKLLGARYTRLRARIKYDPVTAITGQVYSPWRNVSSILDANNLGVLPIELISFNAAWMQKGKTAKLDFKTDKESGICCFDIEKSNDGFNFNFIGSLPAKNVSGIQSYSFIDDHATGKKQFYRLKIKGITGQFDYSNIQQLQNDGATEILVFPNPTADILNLRLNNTYDKIVIVVINSSGQLMKRLQVSANTGLISIPVQNLAAGQYWLHLQSGNEKQVLQFVKK
ncbi:MAG: FG-GAP-like repeat-containing protein [Ferruginibacter sp.]